MSLLAKWMNNQLQWDKGRQPACVLSILHCIRCCANKEQISRLRLWPYVCIITDHSASAFSYYGYLILLDALLHFFLLIMENYSSLENLKNEVNYLKCTKMFSPITSNA
jgi:hypothetical protein